jgi:hypothetical protein
MWIPAPIYQILGLDRDSAPSASGGRCAFSPRVIFRRARCPRRVAGVLRWPGISCLRCVIPRAGSRPVPAEGRMR